MKPEIVCYCKKVSRFTIQKAIQEGAKSIEDIRWATEACKDDKCVTMNPKGISCAKEVKEMIIAVHGCLSGNCNCCN